MKTLADFKRALHVGKKIHTIFHCAFSHRDETGKTFHKDEDKGIREISIVQATQFAVKTTKADGTSVDSWCMFPKASEVKIDGNKITIMEADRVNSNIAYPVLTYTLIDE